MLCETSDSLPVKIGKDRSIQRSAICDALPAKTDVIVKKIFIATEKFCEAMNTINTVLSCDVYVFVA